MARDEPGVRAVMDTRIAQAGDAAVIARIYNEGIEDRIATFETDPRNEDDIRKWLDGPHPIFVAVDQEIIAFAAAQPSSTRACYSKNAEFSVYVARAYRGRGAGKLVMRALIDRLRTLGFNKLQSMVFADNEASIALLERVGFRRVGTYERHGTLDGKWRDVVIVECLL